MSISQNFPAIRPTLNLDFANVGRLDPRITFTRASTATYFDANTTAKAEENLLTRSQEFENADWGATNLTVAANTGDTTAPDGTSTAEKLTDDATSGAHICSQNITISANTPFTFSCFLKEGTNTHAYISIRDAATSQRYFAADFNLDTGTVRTTAAGTSGTLTSSSITSVGNDWYRCVITGEVSAVGAMRAIIGVSDGTTAFNTLGAILYSGTGTTIYAWGAQLEQRSAVTAYTPTTTQAITNYIPVLETAAAGVARFDHNPTTGESLGLLVEEQRTNLLTYSEDFADAAWTKTRSSITSNTIVAPDGTLTGDKLVEDTTASNTHLTAQNITTSETGSYTYSVFAKAGERTQMIVARSTTNITIFSHTFDLSAGTASGGGVITAVGNGWYRCAGTVTVESTGSTGVQFRLSDGSSSTYTGDGYSGIFIWGAQLE